MLSVTSCRSIWAFFSPIELTVDPRWHAVRVELFFSVLNVIIGWEHLLEILCLEFPISLCCILVSTDLYFHTISLYIGKNFLHFSHFFMLNFPVYCLAYELLNWIVYPWTTGTYDVLQLCNMRSFVVSWCRTLHVILQFWCMYVICSFQHCALPKLYLLCSHFTFLWIWFSCSILWLCWYS